MRKSDKVLSLLFYGFVFSIIGISSIYLGSKLLIIVKNDDNPLIFNAPVATLIATLLFFIWELFIKKADRTLLINSKNIIIQAAFLSLVITILIFLFVIYRNLPFSFLKQKILEYLFILIPINTVLVLIKISSINRSGYE